MKSAPFRTTGAATSTQVAILYSRRQKEARKTANSFRRTVALWPPSWSIFICLSSWRNRQIREMRLFQYLGSMTARKVPKTFTYTKDSISMNFRDKSSSEPQVTEEIVFLIIFAFYSVRQLQVGCGISISALFEHVRTNDSHHSIKQNAWQTSKGWKIPNTPTS